MAEEQKKKDILDDLKQLRDELKVKMRLGSMDAHDEWSKLEAKFKDINERLKPAGEAAFVAVDTAAAVLAEELQGGYEHLRKVLSGKENAAEDVVEDAGEDAGEE